MRAPHDLNDPMRNMLYRLISRKVLHTGSPTNQNQFIAYGVLHIGKVTQPGERHLEFRLVEEPDVAWLIVVLPRVIIATLDWNGPGTRGIMQLELQSSPTGGGSASKGGDGPSARTLKVTDLRLDISRDKNLSPSKERRISASSAHSRSPGQDL